MRMFPFSVELYICLMVTWWLLEDQLKLSTKIISTNWSGFYNRLSGIATADILFFFVQKLEKSLIYSRNTTHYQSLV